MILKIGNNLRVSGIGTSTSLSVDGERSRTIGYRVSAKTENREPKTELAFTLVELMISVVILGFGLCVVIQSYMSALSGFNTIQNYIAAMRFAKGKIIELETAAYENKGLLPETKSDRTTLGTRKFNWKAEVNEIFSAGNFSKDFVMATVSMDWQERNIHKNSAIVTYLPKRQELEEEQ